MRPKTLDDLVGHNHLIGKKTALRTMIEEGHVPSLLLYGPAGCGKTSLAYAIAGTSKLPFYMLNATGAGKKDIEEVVGEARLQGKVLLFIDEIHRFNKLQQDALLPHVESGWIVLIGATTENPFHDVNPAIRSRCGQIKKLEPVRAHDIITLLERAITAEKRGLRDPHFIITKKQLSTIAHSVQGDVRSALNVLEDIFYATKRDEDGKKIVIDEVVEQCLEGKGILYSKSGDEFYDLLSALQKSIRGSDTDAALHYLARLIQGGDLTAICRRLLVIAYEDCGLAGDMGMRTYCAVETAKAVGFPEARIPLSQIVIEQCLANKSNSAYKAIDAALADLQLGKAYPIPPHLRDAHYNGASQLGHGKAYRYPHDETIGTFGGWIQQSYLPDELKGKQYYKPIVTGQEQRLKGIYEKLEQLQKGVKND